MYIDMNRESLHHTAGTAVTIFGNNSSTGLELDGIVIDVKMVLFFAGPREIPPLAAVRHFSGKLRH